MIEFDSEHLPPFADGPFAGHQTGQKAIDAELPLESDPECMSKIEPASNDETGDAETDEATALSHNSQTGQNAIDGVAEQPMPSIIHPETMRIAHTWITSARLRGYVRSRIGNGNPTQDVDDICQEVVMALLKGWPTSPPISEKEKDDPDDGENRWSLMYGIAAHKIADYYRRAGRDKSEPVDELPDSLPIQGADKAFFEGWDKQHIWMVATQTLRSPTQREIFELMMAGLKAEEKAKLLGITAVSVRVAEFRIREKIKKALQLQYGGQEVAFGYRIPELAREEVTDHVPPPIKRSAPRPTVSEVRDDAIAALHTTCEKGIANGTVELSAHIPVYLGAWTTGLFALEQLRSQDASRPSVVVFPYEQLLPDFRNFVHARLGSGTESYRIETPETLIAWPGGRSLEHALVLGNTDETLAEHLRAKSSFILRLLQDPPKPSAEEADIFRAPGYKDIGSKMLLWAVQDSVHLFEEWRFTTGQELTLPAARDMSAAGIGPSFTRLTRSATYRQLRAKAGYPKTSKPSQASKSPNTSHAEPAGTKPIRWQQYHRENSQRATE